MSKKALILCVRLPNTGFSNVDSTVRLEEDCRLAETLELEVVEKHLCVLRHLKNSGTLIGKGWIEKIGQAVSEHHLDVVIVDPDLSPLQQRNLERHWKCKVWDRTALILEIFAQRARTSAGKMQVRLAQLMYQRSRLVKTWTHLERQRGGFGFLGGPGESQLELDKRMLEEKIRSVKEDLEKVRKTRNLHRKARDRVPYPVIALVGYTNAGKSTLFNRLTEAKVAAEDKLFATLDPTMRKITLPSRQTVILSDTVGFISDLPQALREAFSATLEEVQSASLLIHVHDGASSHREQQASDVQNVLDSLDCQMPIVHVINKADLLSDTEKEGMVISAKTGEGIDHMLYVLDEKLQKDNLLILLHCNSAEGQLIHWLHEQSHVIDTIVEPTGYLKITIRIPPIGLQKLISYFPDVHIEHLKGL